MKKRPITLMLFTALLSFCVCEGIAQFSQESPTPEAGSALQVEAIPQGQNGATQTLVTARARRTIHPERSESFTQKIARAFSHTFHSTETTTDLSEDQFSSANEVASYVPVEMSQAILPRYPLNLGLVPEVVILPKNEEPQTSSALFDKHSQAMSMDRTQKSLSKIDL
jgi:hypothetical protein